MENNKKTKAYKIINYHNFEDFTVKEEEEKKIQKKKQLINKTNKILHQIKIYF